MKILGIFLIVLFLSLSLSISMDFLLGFDFPHILFHLQNPFWVMDPGEYVMLILFLLLTLFQQIMIIIKNKTNKQDGSN